MFLLTALVFAIFSAAPASAESPHHHDPVSVHGMLMMGSRTVYLSHLPMFHSPHDYQAIIEAEIDTVSKEAYLLAKKDPNEAVYTLVPEPFVLPELIANPRPFKAEIFKGHFERGGSQIATGVTVTIKRVLYFKKFDPAEKPPVFAKYLVFGDGVEQFVAHAVTAKPDFDEVIEIYPNRVLSAFLKTRPATFFEPRGHSNKVPLQKMGGVLALKINGGTDSSYLQFKRHLYLEHGDLSH